MGRFRAISLFTGAGGLDFGFEAAGFDTVVSVEFDRASVATLRGNRDWPVDPRDISRVSSKSLLQTACTGVGEADVLIGGPPCQPFSKSGFWAQGQSARLNDMRARTLTAFMRVLGDTLPKAFLLENVEGLGFRGKDEGLQFLTAELERINARSGTSYAPSVAVLNAADFGVPQRRRRLFVIGARNGARFRFPSPTHGGRHGGTNAGIHPHMTAWDALWDIEEEGSDLAVRGKWASLLPTIPEGENYLWHTERGGGEPLFGWRRRYWNFLLKLSKERPAWTLQAHPGPATGPFHWANRRLSVREMMRLQTFPEDIAIAGTLADAQRQLGNAVPSLLAEVLAREIRRQLLGAPAESRGPQLGVRPAPVPAPPPEKLHPVPLCFLDLRGWHSPHPGTGLGRRARMRPAQTARAAE